VCTLSSALGVCVDSNNLGLELLFAVFVVAPLWAKDTDGDATTVLALSAPGNVLVVDQGNSRIVLFSAAGEVVRTIGEGQLRDPYGDDDPFIVLTETKFSFRCIPVWIGTLLTGLGSKKRTHVIMFSP
jgi:hypothetical protein